MGRWVGDEGFVNKAKERWEEKCVTVVVDLIVRLEVKRRNGRGLSIEKRLRVFCFCFQLGGCFGLWGKSHSRTGLESTWWGLAVPSIFDGLSFWLSPTSSRAFSASVHTLFSLTYSKVTLSLVYLMLPNRSPQDLEHEKLLSCSWFLWVRNLDGEQWGWLVSAPQCPGSQMEDLRPGSGLVCGTLHSGLAGDTGCLLGSFDLLLVV